MTTLITDAPQRVPFASIPNGGEGIAGLGAARTWDVVVVSQTGSLANYAFRWFGSYQARGSGLMFEYHGTRSPLSYTIRLVTVPGVPVAYSPQDAVPATPAMRLLERIKNASGLTLESIAPLAGVSRRSVQSWRAGDAISQRNEEHLCALAEAIDTIAAADPLRVRERLMERVSGSIRIYDLLAEGRYEDAIARTRGTRPVPQPITHSEPTPLSVPLAAQVATLESPATTLDPRIDRRFTKRLKR